MSDLNQVEDFLGLLHSFDTMRVTDVSSSGQELAAICQKEQSTNTTNTSASKSPPTVIFDTNLEHFNNRTQLLVKEGKETGHRMTQLDIHINVLFPATQQPALLHSQVTFESSDVAKCLDKFGQILRNLLSSGTGESLQAISILGFKSGEWNSSRNEYLERIFFDSVFRELCRTRVPSLHWLFIRSCNLQHLEALWALYNRSGYETFTQNIHGIRCIYFINPFKTDGVKSSELNKEFISWAATLNLERFLFIPDQEKVELERIEISPLMEARIDTLRSLALCNVALTDNISSVLKNMNLVLINFSFVSLRTYKDRWVRVIGALWRMNFLQGVQMAILSYENAIGCTGEAELSRFCSPYPEDRQAYFHLSQNVKTFVQANKMKFAKFSDISCCLDQYNGKFLITEEDDEMEE